MQWRRGQHRVHAEGNKPTPSSLDPGEASGVRVRDWLAVGICLAVYLLLVMAQQLGWHTRSVPLGEPYLGQCVHAGKGYRCSSSVPSLTVVSLPIKLKAKREYIITLVGHSLTPNPAIVYVDFFGVNYDSPHQKGQVRLFAGAVGTHLLRWSSEMPPVNAFLRLNSGEASDYEITSVEIRRSSRWLSPLFTLIHCVGLLLLLHALWHARRWLFEMRLKQYASHWIAAAPLGVLALLVTTVAVLLLVRVSTMGAPMVFGDEMSYALLSASLGDPTMYWHNPLLRPLPNQLFFDVYYLAGQCGEATLGCARALNSVLFALAAFPLFALSRRFMSTRHALLLTATILLLPNSSYTGFFMPESFYFLGFYIAVWAFVAFLHPDGGNRQAAIAGFGLAALSLVKPHGLTILLACNLTLLIALCVWRGDRRRIALGWCVLLAVFVVSHSVLGISAAPSNNVTWFDQLFGLYASMIAEAAHISPDPQSLTRLMLAAANNIGSLLLLFGPPLLLSACWLLRRRSDLAQSEDIALDRLHLFTLVTVTCLLVGTIKFTAYIAGVDPNQDADRIHQRYYDFSFGLLLVGAWSSLQAMSRQSHQLRTRAFVLLLPIGGTALWYLAHGFRELRPSWVDHPVLFATWDMQSRGVAYVTLVIILSLLLLPLRPKIASSIYLAGLLAICVAGFQSIWRQQAASQVLLEEDRAVLALKSLYTPAQLEHGLIIGEALPPLSRTTFYLHNNATLRRLPPGSVVDVEALAGGAKWVLTYGRYQVPGDWEPGLKLPADATLYQRPSGE